MYQKIGLILIFQKTDKQKFQSNKFLFKDVIHCFFQ